MPGCPACKIILNDDLESSIKTFHKFADMGILSPADIELAMRADVKALKVYRKIIEGAAARSEKP